eukprot:9028833-Pyramimonas_sp.AAC.1
MALLTSGETGAKFFTLEKLQEILSPESSYLLKSPGQGGKNAILNLAAGLDVALLETSVFPDVTGMEAVFAELQSHADSIKNLHAGHAELDKEKSRRAATVLLRHFGHKTSAEDRVAKYAALADAGSRLVTCAFACMELTALAIAPKEWGKHLSSGDTGKQHAAWNKFASKPNMENLAIAFAAGIKKDSEDKGVKKKKFAFGDTGADSAGSSSAAASDSSSDSSSTSGSKGKKKKKKSSKKPANKTKGSKKKKDKKAAKADESSDEDKAEKSKKKTKKDKKKKKRGSSSSSDSESAPKKKKDKKSKKEKNSSEDAEVKENAVDKVDKPSGDAVVSPEEKAFSEWKLSDAQMILGKAHEHLQGNPSLAELQKLFGTVPAAVIAYAGVEEFMAQLASMKSAPKNEVSKPPLTALKTAAEKCEAWFASQQQGGGSSAKPAKSDPQKI